MSLTRSGEIARIRPRIGDFLWACLLSGVGFAITLLLSTPFIAESSGQVGDYILIPHILILAGVILSAPFALLQTLIHGACESERHLVQGFLAPFGWLALARLEQLPELGFFASWLLIHGSSLLMAETLCLLPLICQRRGRTRQLRAQ